MRRWICCLLLIFLLMPSASSREPERFKSVHPVSVSLETAPVLVHDGIHYRLKFKIQVQPGWHIYGPEVGEFGQPLVINWDVPTGSIVTQDPWPQTKQYTDFGFLLTGYEGSFQLTANLEDHRSIGARGQALEVRATLKWTACNKICVPGVSHASLVLNRKPKDII